MRSLTVRCKQRCSASGVVFTAALTSLFGDKNVAAPSEVEAVAEDPVKAALFKELISTLNDYQKDAASLLAFLHENDAAQMEFDQDTMTQRTEMALTHSMQHHATQVDVCEAMWRKNIGEKFVSVLDELLMLKFGVVPPTFVRPEREVLDQQLRSLAEQFKATRSPPTQRRLLKEMRILVNANALPDTLLINNPRLQDAETGRPDVRKVEWVRIIFEWRKALSDAALYEEARIKAGMDKLPPDLARVTHDMSTSWNNCHVPW